MDFEIEDMKTLPIWVQLKLGLKHWGEKSLHKIVSQLDPIKRDEGTRNRDKIQYARILVEMKVDKEILDSIHFINEHNMDIDVHVVYEWMPQKYAQC